MSEDNIEIRNRRSNTPVRATGRKIPQDYENPIDNLMMSGADVLAPHLKKINYTANGITTLSLICGAAAMYHLYNHDIIPFTIYMLLGHFFDDMDGLYARKYGMVTDNGDKYDHYKDLLLVVASIYILYSKYNILDFPVMILVICCIGVLGIMFVGCQESLTASNHRSDTLAFANYVTPKKENCKSYIKYLRYFGPGTIIVLFIMIAWYLDNQMNITTNVNPDIVDISRPFRDFGQSTSNIHALTLTQPLSGYSFFR
jgi:phosphatidylglycerophosphate synthase